jgi:hypothetical protein
MSLDHHRRQETGEDLRCRMAHEAMPAELVMRDVNPPFVSVMRSMASDGTCEKCRQVPAMEKSRASFCEINSKRSSNDAVRLRIAASSDCARRKRVKSQ